MITVAITLLIIVGVVMVVLGCLFKTNKLSQTSVIAAIGFGLIISCWSMFLVLMVLIFVLGGDIK
ncbi:hypothetical protein BELINDA_30 [Bacillus phage Belinda]|uniref:hypothetical protein n=1 Tax=Bacillus phage Belinda TaxID=1852564 RepID=UPI0007F0BDF1|nr:hypothetical protein BI039_gp030 [Bacillus phage Belinda]ANM45959.1 hypothetical protein BELINDA_30 [Bacillus phage Belinda]